MKLGHLAEINDVLYNVDNMNNNCIMYIFSVCKGGS